MATDWDDNIYYFLDGICEKINMNASLLISIQTKLAVNRKCKIHFELVKHILTVDLLFSALIGFFFLSQLH